MRLINWVKQNKLAVLLLALVGLYLLRNIVNSFFGVSLRNLDVSKTTPVSPSYSGSGASPEFSNLTSTSFRPPTQDYAPQPNVSNRLVIQESNLSLLVKDVADVRNKIVGYAQTSGGYMVSSNVSNPQDAPSATVIVRIQSDKLEEALTFFRSLSIKVVSENLLGKDVTDQYVDIDTRITQLEKTKTKLEEILSLATEISDITNLTQQILNYQNQIDSYKGQQDALEKNAQLAKLTIYLSTDEIALPYAPSETFRPQIIFKLAVRSLVGFLRNLATLVIWLGVYSVVWVPVLLIVWYLRKRRSKKSPGNLPN